MKLNANSVLIRSTFAILLLGPACGFAGNMNTSAGTASGAQGMAIPLNNIAGAMHTTKCVAPKPSPIDCVMAFLSFKQADLMGGTKSGADRVRNITFDRNGNAISTTAAPSTPPAPDPFNGDLDKFVSDIKSDNPKIDLSTPAGLALAEKYGQLAQKKLAAKGFSADRNGNVKTPDGKTLSAGSFSGGAGFNLSAEDLKDLKKIQEKVAVGYAASNSGVLDGTAGGGGGSRVPAAGDDEDPMAGFDMSKYLKGDKKAEPTLSGLTKTLNSGERVGVAADDIFQMVQRQYQKQDQSGRFLK